MLNYLVHYIFRDSVQDTCVRTAAGISYLLEDISKEYNDLCSETVPWECDGIIITPFDDDKFYPASMATLHETSCYKFELAD